MYCHDCDALADIGDKSAVEPLLPFLHDENPVIARGAVNTLAKLNDPRAVPPLTALLKEPSMRIPVMDALVEMKQCQIMPEIRPGLTDDNEEVRRATANAIVKCKDTGSFDLLIHVLKLDPPLAINTLASLGDTRAVPPLLAILNQKDAKSKNRPLAAHALGQLHDASAVDPLIAVLQQEKTQPIIDYLKQEVAWALGQIGDQRAVPVLQQIVSSAPLQVDSQLASAQWQLASSATMALNALGAPVPKPQGHP